MEYRRGELTGDELEAIVRSCGYGIAGQDEFLSIQTRGGTRWVQAFIDHVDEATCNCCGGLREDLRAGRLRTRRARRREGGDGPQRRQLPEGLPLPQSLQGRGAGLPPQEAVAVPR